MYPDGCAGKQQSPIDIRTTQTEYDPKLNDFAIWFDPPKPGSTFHVVNNGHTIQVNMGGDFHVTNGGLPSVYKTAQFHFHWGHADHQGSEHLIDNRASPLELHIVNYDSVNYKSIGTAMVQPMGLAVLGVMYEVGDEDNEALEPILQAMEHVKDPENDLIHDLPAQRIRDFLPSDTTKYYRYNGSLTTPGCFESVIWTVFDEPLYISQRQMSAFRRILQMKVQHENHAKKSHHHKKHKRSADEKMIGEVLEEAGIRSDPLEKIRLDVALEDKKNPTTTETRKENPVITETPKLGESPKKFYLHHEENPNMDELMKNVNQSSNNKEQTYSHVDNEAKLEEKVAELEIEVERLKLVNNFRPPQLLHGRVVYRSFDNLAEQRNANAVRLGSQGTKDPQNNSSIIMSSLSLLVSVLLISVQFI